MIEMISLVVAGVVIEYGFFTSWKELNKSLNEEGDRNIFEFLG